MLMIPLLWSKLFRFPKVVNTKGFPLRKFSALLDKKFDGKSLYSSLPIQIFSLPEIYATVKDSPTKYFGTVRQIIFDRKS